MGALAQPGGHDRARGAGARRPAPARPVLRGEGRGRASRVARAAPPLNPVRRPAGPDANPKAVPLVAAYRRLVLDALDRGRERPIPPAAWEDDLRLGLQVSRAVGRACGERLYQALRAGRVTPASVRKLYRVIPASPRAALAAMGEAVPAAASVA